MEHALVIDRHGLAIWRHAREDLARECQLAADDGEAPARLVHWARAARRRCTLIADLADERHALERLPRISPADRRLLIRRRLNEHFPDSALTSARPLPASAADGPFRPVLLAALTRPRQIAPWLEALAEAGAHGHIEVRCLTSVPFLLERWYRRQRTLPAHALLLAPGAGGMRLAFFRQRRLVFSRIIPAREKTLAANLPAYRDELAQTLAWLAAQRLCNGPPPIRVLAGAAELPSLRELSLDPHGGDIDFIDLAPHLPAVHGTAPDILPLALREARRHGTLGQYACPPLQSARRLVRARQAIIAATVVLSGAALAASACDLIDANEMHGKLVQLETRQRAQQSEIAALAASARAAPDAAMLARELPAAEHLAHAPAIAPAAVLQAIADALAATPWARLDALAWSPTPEAAVEIELEIGFGPDAPAPQTAADMLAAHWRQQHDTTPRTRTDSAANRLFFTATLATATLPRKDAP
ncbi:MAG: hypothetical protein LBI92_00255 [Azoarcus sp.]|jgi:hypothetical protein|nr:hypothetical protein [Azoarcus sp.]